MSKITADFVKSIKKTYIEVGVLLSNVKLVQRDVQTIRDRIIEDSDKVRSNCQTSDAEQNSPSITASNATLSERENNNSAKQHQSFLGNQYERWQTQLSRPKFQVSLLTLVFLITYTCETRKTNKLTQKSLDLTRESTAAQIVAGDWDFTDPVVPGSQIAIKVPLTNIGHSPAVYGIETVVFRWARMPDDIPIEAPQPNVAMEPNKPMTQTTQDGQIATEEFIYSIPHLRDTSKNPITRHLEPPLPRPTVFLIGRLVYDSLGIRTEKQFCFFMVYADEYAKRFRTPPTDPRFAFISCPKWNTSIQTPIK